MEKPVRLSQEKWDALTRGGHPDYEKVSIMISTSTITGRTSKEAFVREPMEFDGIVFLPATYAPPAS